MIARTIIARTIIAGNIIARNAAMFLVNLKLNSLTIFKDPYPPPLNGGVFMGSWRVTVLSHYSS